MWFGMLHFEKAQYLTREEKKGRKQAHFHKYDWKSFFLPEAFGEFGKPVRSSTLPNTRYSEVNIS